MKQCKYCGDEIKFEIWYSMEKSCLECYNELNFGIIINQNIHLCSSPATCLDTIDGDTDMFSPSWKVDN